MKKIVLRILKNQVQCEKKFRFSDSHQFSADELTLFKCPPQSFVSSKIFEHSGSPGLLPNLLSLD